ncbi:hypothetical protein GJAV_G00271530 [Gymnothorax javanicus]|nr:hypothetical protein GJAV_G00271530 [Gymnothorax javanicus]
MSDPGVARPEEMTKADQSQHFIRSISQAVSSSVGIAGRPTVAQCFPYSCRGISAGSGAQALRAPAQETSEL